LRWQWIARGLSLNVKNNFKDCLSLFIFGKSHFHVSRKNHQKIKIRMNTFFMRFSKDCLTHKVQIINEAQFMKIDKTKNPTGVDIRCASLPASCIETVWMRGVSDYNFALPT
jgi:hypothetical protein